VVTADHGGLDDHGRNLDEDEAVPFVVAVEPVSDRELIRLQPLQHPVHHYDVAPTVLRWLGIPSASPIDGVAQAVPADHPVRLTTGAAILIAV
jgi:arylsulfatase A-like enzyme